MKQRVIMTISFLLLITGLENLSLAQILTPGQVESKTATGIRYFSGGVGEDEQAMLSALGRSDNLKLVFATREGHYLSDVAVVIKDSNGSQVLAVVTDGPWLYTDLPAGKYVISATNQGETRQQTVRVTAGKQTQQYFYW